MSFKVFTVGVGNAFSTENAGTSFVLQKDDFHLGIDCPGEYRRLFAKLDHRSLGRDFGVGDLDALLITHLHGDHVNGLEMTLAYRAFVLDSKLQLYGSPEVAQNLWTNRLEVALGRTWTGDRYQKTSPDEFYSLTPIDWGGCAQIGPFEVHIKRTLHHIPTSALFIDDGDASLGYSCDTEFDAGLIRWLESADLLLHETGPGPGHTSLSQLEALPERTRRKIRLVHYPDQLSDSDTHLKLAQPDATYEVPPPPHSQKSESK